MKIYHSLFPLYWSGFVCWSLISMYVSYSGYHILYKTCKNTFRYLDFNGLLQPLFITLLPIMVSKNFPVIHEDVVIICVTQNVTIAILCPAKTPLSKALGAYNSKPHGEILMLSTFDKKDKMQLLTKFKKKSVGRVQSRLRFLYKDILTSILSHLMTSSVPNLHNTKNLEYLWNEMRFDKKENTILLHF